MYPTNPRSTYPGLADKDSISSFFLSLSPPVGFARVILSATRFSLLLSFFLFASRLDTERLPHNED